MRALRIQPKPTLRRSDAALQRLGQKIVGQITRQVTCKNAQAKTHEGPLKNVDVIMAPGQAPEKQLWCAQCQHLNLLEQRRRMLAKSGVHGVA